MFRPSSTREKGTCFERWINSIAAGRGDLREPLELEQLFLRQAVELRQRADETLLQEDANGLFTDALDVGHARPADQRLQAA